jgi:lysophospholipid acyltransferase (LPLAT)-like uncharacterized protein
MRHWIKQSENRLKIGILAKLGYWILYSIGKTLRWQVLNWENIDSVYKNDKRLILAFWHGRLFATSYYFRKRGIVVLTSQHRDGEYIAKIIQSLGYGVARGSSSKGSHGVTKEALRMLQQGKDIGFAIDGPRGPRYRAKAGATYLAWKTGNPVMPFHVAVEKKWTIQSWDGFEIPKPFSRALLIIGKAIYVDPEINKDKMACYQQELQDALDLLRFKGDSWWINLKKDEQFFKTGEDESSHI